MTDPKMPQNVRVKPLEWDGDEEAGYFAMGSGAEYLVEPSNNGSWYYEDEPCKNSEAAKAAAQADYTARILSALEVVEDDVRRVIVTEAMIDAGVEHYSEGGCMGLGSDEKRDVVSDILHAALTKGSTDDRN